MNIILVYFQGTAVITPTMVTLTLAVAMLVIVTADTAVIMITAVTTI